MANLKVLDLFSGIGGFSLGLERSGGFETVAFCEIEPFCQKVLAKHWPGVPIYDDVRNLTADTLRRDGIAVDVICGGFPCQDISAAGAGAGLEGERSGLWSEIARLVCELKPKYVIVENVSALLGRGMGTVLRDLAASGYDAEWQCIPAAAVGAPHRRDRVWVVAYPSEIRCNAGRAEQPLSGVRMDGEAFPIHVDDTNNLANTEAERSQRGSNGNRNDRTQGEEWSSEFSRSCGGIREVSNPMRQSLAHGGQPEQQASAPKAKWEMAFAELKRRSNAQWAFEPELGRVAYGVPNRVDRVAALGNAVVPQIPELIGRAILEAIDGQP